MRLPLKWMVGAVAGLWGGYELLWWHTDLGAELRRELHEHPGKGEKRYTGLSFADQTDVRAAASPSAIDSRFDEERVWSGYDDWEPILAADPRSGVLYQLTTRYNGPPACRGCPYPVIVMRKSTDGGNTFGADRFIPITKNGQYDPQLAVANDGTLYLVWIDGYEPGVRFSRSADGGNSWTAPLKLTPRRGTPNWSDKPILAISPSGRHVYIAWNASDSWVAASHDHGDTFAANVKTSSDKRYWFHTAGVVDPGGDVYFMTADFRQDYTGDAHIGVLSSSDGGASFSHTRIDTSRQMPDCSFATDCYLGFFGPIGGIAADKNGTLLAGYNASSTPSGPMQLYAKTSTDGIHWSARLDIGGGATVNHHSVQVAVGASVDEFVVVWQDDRLGATTAWNAWMRHTKNRGSTWAAPVRLSDRADGAPYKSAAGHRFPYGDYLGVTHDSAGTFHFIWGEGDTFKGPGGVWYTKGK